MHFWLINMCTPSSLLLSPQLIASEDKYVHFLLTLCDFAIEHKFIQLRDTVRTLLKLLPTGIQLLSNTLDHCRESSEQLEAYDRLKRHIITTSVSTTLYHLEVGGLRTLERAVNVCCMYMGSTDKGISPVN